MDAKRAEVVARIIGTEVDVETVGEVLAEVLRGGCEEFFEPGELWHCSELLKESMENPDKLRLPLGVAEQTFVEPVRELREHRVLACVAELVVEATVGIQDGRREGGPHRVVGPCLAAVLVAACERVADRVAVPAGVVRVVCPLEVDRLSASAVRTRDARHGCADLDGNAVAIAPVKVVVL